LQDETKEQWLLLCEQAAVEQDPQKLLTLVEEINRLLEEKQASLKNLRGNVQRPSFHERQPGPRV